MDSTSTESQGIASDRPDAPGAYELPVVLATFPKQDLAEDIPENITPHIHTIQNS